MERLLCTYFDLGKTRVVEHTVQHIVLIHCKISRNVANMRRDYMRVWNRAMIEIIEESDSKI